MKVACYNLMCEKHPLYELKKNDLLVADDDCVGTIVECFVLGMDVSKDNTYWVDVDGTLFPEGGAAFRCEAVQGQAPADNGTKKSK